MQKDYIYIKLCDGINIPNAKLILKDKCNKVVFESFSEEIGKIRIFVIEKSTN